MSKEFLETCASEPLYLEESVDSQSSCTMHESMGMHNEATRPTAFISQICHDTGKVTSYDSKDLQEQLRQFRLAREFSTTTVTSRHQRPLVPMKWSVVEVDDELHGRDGEWLGVTDISLDQRVVTLQCFESGKVFTRAASALRDDIRGNRLKVHRYWPDAPPEFED